MNCKEYQILTPKEKVELIGSITHLIQSDSWYLEQAQVLIKMGIKDGLFENVVINPIMENNFVTLK